MGEGRIEEIIRLGCYCISVAGKPVGVRVPPLGTGVMLTTNFHGATAARLAVEFDPL